MRGIVTVMSPLAFDGVELRGVWQLNKSQKSKPSMKKTQKIKLPVQKELFPKNTFWPSFSFSMHSRSPHTYRYRTWTKKDPPHPCFRFNKRSFMALKHHCGEIFCSNFVCDRHRGSLKHSDPHIAFSYDWTATFATELQFQTELACIVCKVHRSEYQAHHHGKSFP